MPRAQKELRTLLISTLVFPAVVGAAPPSVEGVPAAESADAPCLKPSCAMTAPVWPLTRGVPVPPSLERLDVLRPAEDAEVRRPFMVLRFADGTRTVTSLDRLPLTPGPDEIGVRRIVEFEVDLQKGTYTTAVVREERLELPNERKAAIGAKNAAGGWYLKYWIETWEPARWVWDVAPLTRTEMEVEWLYCPTGEDEPIGESSIEIRSFRPSCWANPYTFVATTWRQASCSPYLDDDGFSPFATSRGHYYNFDFFLDIWKTEVWESVDVNFFGGSAFKTHSHTARGDSSWLLAGRTFEENAGLPFAQCSSRPPGGGAGDPGGDPGGGDPGGGDPGGGDTGGGDTCVPVYDGETDEYLGDCCGETTSEIVDCAAGYL